MKEKTQDRGAWVTMHRQGQALAWHVVFPAFRHGVRRGTQVHSVHPDKATAVGVAAGLRRPR